VRSAPGWLAVIAASLVAHGPAHAEPGVTAPHLGACGPVPGAYQIPGTAACLRITGFVAAELGGWQTPAAAFAGAARPQGPLTRPISGSAIGADARLSADVHLPTEGGPARIYVSVRGRHGLSSAAR
jgi:hypothetical protein